MKHTLLKRTPNAKRKLEIKADYLWKLAVVKRWGNRCEVCGEFASYPHHYIPKSRNALMRFGIQNGVPLCLKHHYVIHFDKNPERIREALETIRQKRGKKWRDYIDKVKNIHGQSFRSIKYLEKQIKRLEQCLK